MKLLIVLRCYNLLVDTQIRGDAVVLRQESI